MKSKVTFNVLHFAVMTLLLGTSCSSDSDEVVSTSSEEVKVPLSISAVIQSSTEARKADYDATDFEAGDELGLFILDGDFESGYSSSSTKDYNVKATYDGEAWTLSQDVYLSSDKACIIAYYPYKSSFGNNLPVDGTYITIYIPDDNEQTDVLCCSAVTVNSNNSTASLSFDHALTRLTVSVALSDDIETATLSSVSIGSGVTMPIYALLGLSNKAFGIYSDSDHTTTDGITNNCNASLSAGSAYTVDFLIHPDSPSTLEAELVIDGKTYTAELSTTSGLQSGYKYSYNISVNKEEEDILLDVESSSAINAWVEEDECEDIEITYQEDEETTDGSGYVNGYEAVDLGLSVRWASVNIGAESPEDFGNYYAWGEIETKDEYTKDNSVTWEVEMEDISCNAEYDVATAKWGGSWRMPTCAEMKELVAACTWTWTTQNDITGYLVTGDNGNSIFLPAAGIRFGSSLGGGYSYGYYWSSSPYSSEPQYAYYLCFDFYKHYVTSEGGRYYGCSARPVSD